MARIISRKTINKVNELLNGKYSNLFDWSQGNGAEIIVVLCSELQGNNIVMFKIEIDSLYGQDYPGLKKEINKVLGHCTCKTYKWGEHICSYDFAIGSKSFSLCKCCPFCRQKCIADLVKRKSTG